MQAKEIVNRLRQFDAYPKTLEDFRVKTFGGAAGVYTVGLLTVTYSTVVSVTLTLHSNTNTNVCYRTSNAFT